MFKVLSKIYFPILILTLSFCLSAEDFDPTKVSPETESFVKGITQELNFKNFECGKHFIIFNSDGSLIKGVRNIFYPDEILINEEIFNTISLYEKRYLTGRALSELFNSKRVDNILLNSALPSYIILSLSLVVCGLESDKYNFVTPIKILGIIGTILGSYFTFRSIYKLITIKRKIESKFLSKLNCYDAAILYKKKILDLIKEEKISWLTEYEILADIKKIEKLKEEDRKSKLLPEVV